MSTIEIDRQNTEAWDIRRTDLKIAFDSSIFLHAEAKNINYLKGIADSCRTLGYCYWRFSDYSTSLNYSLKAIDIYRDLDDKKGEADTLNSIGAVYMFEKAYEKRLATNIKCLEIRNQIGDFQGAAGSMNNIGETYFEMGDLNNAQKWFYDCLNNSNSNEQILGWANHNLGKLYYVLRDFENALKYFQESLTLTNRVKYDVLTVHTYLQLATLYTTSDRFENAITFAKKALKLSQQIGAKEEEKDALHSIAKVLEKENCMAEALSYYQRYHELYVQIFNETKEQQIKDIGYQYEIEKVNKETAITKQKNEELKKAYNEIDKQNNLIVEQKKLVDEQNKKLISSLRYAQRTQQALLGDIEQLENNSLSHFILYKPKDIVSGDFYWIHEKEEALYVAAFDCTGHGVPGAFLTMLGTSYLNEIISKDTKPLPSQILGELRNKLTVELSRTDSRDGMDMSILRFNTKTREITWAGAINPLWIIRSDAQEIEIIKGDKQSICFVEEPKPFTDYNIHLNAGDIIYLFSDGYADQFGGKKGKKFKPSRLADLLLSIKDLDMNAQQMALDNSLEEWKGNIEQVDDICIIGLKMPEKFKSNPSVSSD